MDYPVNCHTLNSWWKYLVYMERDPQTNIYTDGTLSDNCLYVNWTPPFLSLNIHMSKYGGGQTLDPEYHLVNIVLRVRETLPAILRRKIHKSAIVSNWFSNACSILRQWAIIEEIYFWVLFITCSPRYRIHQIPSYGQNTIGANQISFTSDKSATYSVIVDIRTAEIWSPVPPHID